MSDFATRDQISSRHARAARIAAEKAARKKKAEPIVEEVAIEEKPGKRTFGKKK